MRPRSVSAPAPRAVREQVRERAPEQRVRLDDARDVLQPALVGGRDAARVCAAPEALGEGGGTGAVGCEAVGREQRRKVEEAVALGRRERPERLGEAPRRGLGPAQPPRRDRPVERGPRRIGGPQPEGGLAQPRPVLSRDGERDRERRGRLGREAAEVARRVAGGLSACAGSVQERPNSRPLPDVEAAAAQARVRLGRREAAADGDARAAVAEKEHVRDGVVGERLERERVPGVEREQAARRPDRPAPADRRREAAQAVAGALDAQPRLQEAGRGRLPVERVADDAVGAERVAGREPAERLALGAGLRSCRARERQEHEGAEARRHGSSGTGSVPGAPSPDEAARACRRAIASGVHAFSAFSSRFRKR